jgi:hypothetical protein
VPQTRCEGCSLVLGLKPYEIDHILEEELVVDKSKPLTIEDGQLLGVGCCHKPKTAERIRMIRKSDRVRDRHTRASKKPSRMPGGRDSNIKIRMDGTPVYRDTGEPVRPR